MRVVVCRFGCHKHAGGCVWPFAQMSDSASSQQGHAVSCTPGRARHPKSVHGPRQLDRAAPRRHACCVSMQWREVERYAVRYCRGIACLGLTLCREENKCTHGIVEGGLPPLNPHPPPRTDSLPHSNGGKRTHSNGCLASVLQGACQRSAKALAAVGGGRPPSLTTCQPRGICSHNTYTLTALVTPTAALVIDGSR